VKFLNYFEAFDFSLSMVLFYSCHLSFSNLLNINIDFLVDQSKLFCNFCVCSNKRFEIVFFIKLLNLMPCINLFLLNFREQLPHISVKLRKVLRVWVNLTKNFVSFFFLEFLKHDPNTVLETSGNLIVGRKSRTLMLF
jgi:hypothetical protein